MADIAHRAGVGIGTLYRRYPSKEALVLQLCLDGMQRLEARRRGPRSTGRRRRLGGVRRLHDGGLAAGAGSLGAALAGTFTPTEELLADRARACTRRCRS